jgi:hypothetical protein
MGTWWSGERDPRKCLNSVASISFMTFRITPARKSRSDAFIATETNRRTSAKVLFMIHLMRIHLMYPDRFEGSDRLLATLTGRSVDGEERAGQLSDTGCNS